MVTPSQVDDRQGLKKMTKSLKGQLFGDKGYISKALQEQLWEKGIQLITKLRRNMKKVVLADIDKILLRKRSLIETLNDQLTQEYLTIRAFPTSQSHRFYGQSHLCPDGPFSWQPKKPSLHLKKSSGMDLIVVGEDHTVGPRFWFAMRGNFSRSAYVKLRLRY